MHNTLVAKNYSPRTMRNYLQEMRFLFAYYHDVVPAYICTQDIVNYLAFIVKEHGVGREKCHQSLPRTSGRGCPVVQLYYKYVFPSSFIVPSAFYPRKQHKLPQVFTIEQIQQLLGVITNQKHLVMVNLFYGTGLRMNELKHLKISGIDSASYQVKVVMAKGGKERFTLLPKHLLEPLRTYYKAHRPQSVPV